VHVSDDAELRRRSSTSGENTSGGGDVISCDVIAVDDVTSSTTMRHVSADELSHAPITAVDLWDHRHYRPSV